MARTRSRAGIAAATAALVALAFTGCAAESTTPDASSGDDKLVIGSMIWNTSVPFYSNFIAGQEEMAEELGVELKLVNGNGDIGTEVSAVQQLITQGVDAILITASDAKAIAPVATQAVEAGIPVFAVNNRVDDSVETVTFIGADDVEFGRQQANLVLQELGEEANVAYMMGALGTSAQLLRKQGFDEVMAEHPGVTVVVEGTSNWDAAEALSVTQDWLNKYPAGEIDAIVAQGPEAANAAKYAKEQGRDDIAFVLGDYPLDVRTAIEDGYVLGTVNQDPKPQGTRSIEAAVQWLTGEKDKVTQPNEYLELPIVTIDNVSEYPAAWGN